MIAEKADSTSFKRGAGCPHCNNTGYRGRIGVYELLEISPEIADTLRRNDTAAFTKAAQRQHHFKSLAQAAMDYALDGVTTVEEVMRIAGEAAYTEDELNLDIDLPSEADDMEQL